MTEPPSLTSQPDSGGLFLRGQLPGSDLSLQVARPPTKEVASIGLDSPSAVPVSLPQNRWVIDNRLLNVRMSCALRSIRSKAAERAMSGK